MPDRRRPAQSKPRTSALERTAYHEAGHAAMAFYLGRAVCRVSVVPSSKDGSRGRVVCRPLPKLRLDADRSPRARRLVERDVMIYLAGGIAEARHKGHGRDLGTAWDLAHAIDYLSYFSTDTDEASAYANWLFVRTRNVLNLPSPWHAVEALAADLLACMEISGKRARQVYQKAIEEQPAKTAGGRE